jgi:DNA-binding NarL/FixJ family response regulator
VPSDPSAELDPVSEKESSETAVPSAVLTLVPDPSEPQSEFAPKTAAISELTAREQDVFMLMARGDTNADIAEELLISEGTVKTHVKRVLSKLDLRDRAQLVVFAYEHRLVVPESGDVAAVSDAEKSRSANAR